MNRPKPKNLSHSKIGHQHVGSSQESIRASSTLEQPQPDSRTKPAPQEHIEPQAGENVSKQIRASSSSLRQHNEPEMIPPPQHPADESQSDRQGAILASSSSASHKAPRGRPFSPLSHHDDQHTDNLDGGPDESHEWTYSAIFRNGQASHHDLGVHNPMHAAGVSPRTMMSPANAWHHDHQEHYDSPQHPSAPKIKYRSGDLGKELRSFQASSGIDSDEFGQKQTQWCIDQNRRLPDTAMPGNECQQDRCRFNHACSLRGSKSFQDLHDVGPRPHGSDPHSFPFSGGKENENDRRPGRDQGNYSSFPDGTSAGRHFSSRQIPPSPLAHSHDPVSGFSQHERFRTATIGKPPATSSFGCEDLPPPPFRAPIESLSFAYDQEQNCQASRTAEQYYMSSADDQTGPRNVPDYNTTTQPLTRAELDATLDDCTKMLQHDTFGDELAIREGMEAEKIAERVAGAIDGGDFPSLQEAEQRLEIMHRESFNMSFEEQLSQLPLVEKIKEKIALEKAAISRLSRSPEEQLPKKKKVMQVFISYTGGDVAAQIFASTLAWYLSKQQVPTFFDANSIRVGELWEAEIERNVAGCCVFVCILTPTFPLRKWCMHELAIALQSNQTKIVPVCLGGEPYTLSDEFRRDFYDTHRSKGLTDFIIQKWEENVLNLESIQAAYRCSTTKNEFPDYLDRVIDAIQFNLAQHQLSSKPPPSGARKLSQLSRDVYDRIRTQLRSKPRETTSTGETTGRRSPPLPPDPKHPHTTRANSDRRKPPPSDPKHPHTTGTNTDRRSPPPPDRQPNRRIWSIDNYYLQSPLRSPKSRENPTNRPLHLSMQKTNSAPKSGASDPPGIDSEQCSNVICNRTAQHPFTACATEQQGLSSNKEDEIVPLALLPGDSARENTGVDVAVDTALAIHVANNDALPVLTPPPLKPLAKRKKLLRRIIPKWLVKNDTTKGTSDKSDSSANSVHSIATPDPNDTTGLAALQYKNQCRDVAPPMVDCWPVAGQEKDDRKKRARRPPQK